MSGFFERVKIPKVELFLILTLLVIGSLIVVLTPFGAGYDEDQHLIRVWQLSDFILVPREMSAQQARFPELFYELSYRKQPLITPIPLDFWSSYAGVKIYDHGLHYGPTRTRSVYSPPLLLPQALAMRYLGRAADLPILVVFYGCRLAGLLTYVLLAWLAVRLIPFGKWVFAVLAVSPIAIYQAATLSADSISNGIGLLFLAGCLAVQQKKELGWKEWVALVGLIALLFLAKLNLVPLIMLPFLTMPPSRFKARGAYPLLIIATVILFLIEVGGWTLRTSSNLSFIASGGVNITEQLRFLLSHPLHFPLMILRDLAYQAPTYFIQWIGTYGFEYGRVPVLAYLFFLLSLGLAVCHVADGDPLPDKKLRSMLALSFILTYLMTCMLFYLTLTAVGENFVYGIQGRYFTAIAPLLFLALYGLLNFERFKASQFSIIASSVAALAVFVVGLFFSYHVTCGPSYYTTSLCYQPVYKNFSPTVRSTVPITHGMTFEQEIIPVCDGMTRIRVRVNSPGENPEGSTEFVVRDVRQDLILAERSVQNNMLPMDAWYSMDFDTQPESKGKLYTITIRGNDSAEGQGPLLAYSITPEYPDGVLYQNGAALEDDLIFQYGCLTGLEKSLQDGK